jgi:nudix-type nucleoside diphosphatase (YffH/AdpP family)
MRVDLIKQEDDYSLLNGKFRIIKGTFKNTLFNGDMSEETVRISFERGDSVAVLIYDIDNDELLFTKQFRFPVYLGLSAEEQHDSPEQAWILEAIAGMVETDATPGDMIQAATNTVKSELLEEAGIVLTDDPEYVHTIYASPGGTSEKIHLFFACVNAKNRIGEGGGVKSEGEDIQIVGISPARFGIGFIDPMLGHEYKPRNNELYPPISLSDAKSIVLIEMCKKRIMTARGLHKRAEQNKLLRQAYKESQ